MMKFLNRVLTATVVIYPLFLSGCFNTGTTSSDVLEIESFSVKVFVEDPSTGKPLTGAIVTVIDDPADVVKVVSAKTSATDDSLPSLVTNEDGFVEFELDASGQLDDNNDGVLDEQTEITVSISGSNGIDVISTFQTIPIRAIGGNDVSLAVADINSPPDGVLVTRNELNLSLDSDSDGELDVDCDQLESDEDCLGVVDVDGDGSADELRFKAADNKGSREVELSLPVDAVYTNRQGAVLDPSSLVVVVTEFDPEGASTASLFPGEHVGAISNVGDLEEALAKADLDGDGNNDLVGEDETLSQLEFLGAAMATAEIRDGAGRVASSVGGVDQNGDPLSIRLRVQIPARTVNPETGEPVKAGDLIPTWSLDDGSAQWRFESIREIIQGDDGKLYSEANTDHFSHYMWGWFFRRSISTARSPTCSSNVRFVDDRGRRVSQNLSIKMYYASSSYTDPFTGLPRTYFRSKKYSYWGERSQTGVLVNRNRSSRLRTARLTVLPQDSRIHTVEILNVAASSSSFFGDTLVADICASSTITIAVDIQRKVPPPSISISYPESVEEVAGLQHVEILLSHASDSAVEVALSVLPSGTATQGADFQTSGSGVFIPPGQTVGRYPITFLDDQELEDVEFVDFEITEVFGAFAEANVFGLQRISIASDDLPALSVEGTTVAENIASGEAVIEISLDQTPIRDVKLLLYPSASFATIGLGESVNRAGIFDFQPRSQVIVFPAGTTQLTQQVPIQIVNDSAPETDERFGVRVYAVQDNSTEPRRATAQVTIRDDGDVAVGDASFIDVTIEELEPVFEGNYFKSPYGVALRLSEAFTQDIRLSLSAVGGTADDRDIVVSSRDIVFQAGETYARGAMFIIGDLEEEVTETVELQLTELTGFNVNLPEKQSLTIFDDDSPRLRLSGSNGKEGGDNPFIRFELTRPSSVDSEIRVEFNTFPPRNFTAINGEDYVAEDQSIVIPAGETFGILELALIDDELIEKFEIAEGVATYKGDPDRFFVGIHDNDSPTISLGDAERVEEGGVLRFPISVIGGVRNVSYKIEAEVQDGQGDPNFSSRQDYGGPSEFSVVISPDEDVAYIEIRTIRDGLDENDEQLILTLTERSVVGEGATNVLLPEVVRSVAFGRIIDVGGTQQTGTGGGSDGSQTGGGGDGI